MRILYELYNGKRIWLEVDEQVGVAYEEIVFIQENRERAENRHRTKRDNEAIIAMLLGQEDEKFTAITCDDEMRLRQAIERLRSKQRALIKAVYFEGVKVSDYARLMGVSQAAISQQIKAAISKIKKFM